MWYTLGFAKAHHKITPIGKSECGLGLRELHKILGFSYNISATAEATTSKTGMDLGFAKSHRKTTHRGKSGRGLGLEKLPNIWGSPLIFLQRPCCDHGVSGASCYQVLLTLLIINYYQYLLIIIYVIINNELLIILIIYLLCINYYC